MLKRIKLGYIVLAVIVLILGLDQFSKLYVKTHFALGEEYRVFSWFRIAFVENPGMAFGFELGGNIGKIALSVFRLLAIGFIGYYVYNLVKSDKLPRGFVVSVAMIFAGAIGNIIDCVFYGMMFNTGTIFDPELGKYIGYMGVSEWGSGYASALQGCVVDMLSFPILSGTFPEWLPFMGGEDFVFFRPVFNVADSAVTVGVALVLIIYWKTIKKIGQKEQVK